MNLNLDKLNHLVEKLSELNSVEKKTQKTWTDIRKVLQDLKTESQAQRMEAQDLRFK